MERLRIWILGAVNGALYSAIILLMVWQIRAYEDARNIREAATFGHLPFQLTRNELASYCCDVDPNVYLRCSAGRALLASISMELSPVLGNGRSDRCQRLERSGAPCSLD